MRWSRQAFLHAALLAAGLLAGCSDPAPDAGATEQADKGAAEGGVEGPVLTLAEDPAGDAYIYNTYWGFGSIPCPQTPAVNGSPDSCDEGAAAVSVALSRAPIGSGPHGAVPAHPARDLLGLRMQESRQTLGIFLDLASLGDDFAGAHEGAQGTYYTVEWLDEASGCYVGTHLDVVPMSNGLGTDGYLFTWCADAFAAGMTPPGPCQFPTCWWAVPLEIEFGAPATLHWTVQRQDLPSAGAIVSPLAVSGVFTLEWGGISSTGPVELGFYRTPEKAGYIVDMIDGAEPFSFATAPGSTPRATLPVHLDNIIDAPIADPARPDLHILGADFEEADGLLRATVHLARVDETPLNHTLGTAFSIPGFDIDIGYEAVDGVRRQFASLYDKDFSQSSFPMILRIEPGAPGKVIMEFQRSDVPPVPDDGVVSELWALTAVRTEQAFSVGDTGVRNDVATPADYVANSAAVRLSPDPDPDRLPPAGRFIDALLDTQPPQDLALTSTSRFDLTAVEITSTKPGEVRISLGVRDMAGIAENVPGYDDVFYAVGVETEQSTTMVGYHRGEAHASGAWLCAPDTTVFEATPQDPVTTTWLPIVGRIVEGATGGRGGGSAGNAAFLMSVPAACFGLDGNEPSFDITRIAAGSYLIRSGVEPPLGAPVAQTVHRMDTMEPEGGFTLTFATIPDPVPSFWDAPFGLEQFWNIFGAALAVITVLGTFLVFLRRRGVMKGYIQDIARLEKLHIGEPVARAAALVALRRRLHRDIVRHRVSDSSYLLDRLRSSITSARLVTLGESFYDLPTALALRIERLLDDGRLTMEEQSMLEPLVGRSKMPPPDRDRLIQRLQRWVAEDAGTDS